MLSLKKSLQRSNGWRRLWFVASVLLLLYTALIHPFVATSDSVQSSFEYLFAVQRDFENPACQPYWTKPMSELTEPKFDSRGGGCWHLYTHRTIYKPQKLPFTPDDYKAYHSRERWTTLLTVSGIFSAGALILSGLVYFAGVVLAWIIAGFRKKDD